MSFNNFQFFIGIALIPKTKQKILLQKVEKWDTRLLQNERILAVYVKENLQTYSISPSKKELTLITKKAFEIKFMPLSIIRGFILRATQTICIIDLILQVGKMRLASKI